MNGLDGLTAPDFGQSDVELIVSRVMNMVKPVVATISREMMPEPEPMPMSNASSSSFRVMM